jgi:hypothetical protein
MGYVLLMIESLAWSLLFVATVLACAGRLRRRWLRLALALPVPLALVLIHVGLTFFAGRLELGHGIGGWFYPILALTAFFVAGTAWLLVKGLRQADGEGAASAAWPRGKLAMALSAAVALYCMTFWNLDMAARQQLAAIRVEAGALALSVAPPRLPDRDNAAFVYQRAFEAMGRPYDRNEAASGVWQWDDAWTKAWNEKWSMWPPSGKIEYDVRDPELRRFLAREETTLKLLRQAAAMPGCYFERDYGRPNVAMPLPELQPLLTGARLLAVDSICQAADGRYRQAIDDIHALFRMAEHVGGDPLLVSMLVAIAMEHLAVDSLQHVLASNRVPDNELADLKTFENASYHVLLGRGLHFEEALRLATFDDVGSGRIALNQFGAIVSGRNISDWLADWFFARFYPAFLLRGDLAAQRQFAAELDLAARQPYWQAKDRMKEFDVQLRNKPGGILTAFLMPSLGPVLVAARAGDARRDAARLGLAIYSYRARNGRLPAKLDDLVPEFIAAVPSDPFDGNPMKLRRADRGLTVYSIGPAASDESKSPFPLDSERKQGEISFTVSEVTAEKKEKK